MKNKRIQRWFNSFWLTILLLFVAIGIFIGNICVLVYVEGNAQSAWLTLISGWVSGVATVILGVIAVVQNKNYTLIATKMELKDSIGKEQLKLSELSNIVLRYSNLKNPLNIVVANNVTQKDLLCYNLELDNLREQFLLVSHQIQLLKFTPKTMILLNDKIIDFIKYTYEDYQAAKDHCFNDNLLSKDINKIGKYISLWSKCYIELCQQAMKELADFAQIVNKANSIYIIKELLLNLDQETLNAQKQIAKSLNQEQHNG